MSTSEAPARAPLLALSDLTLAEYMRYLAAYGGEIREEDGLLLFAGAHRQPNPFRNGALRLRDGLSAEEVLALAGAFFGARKSSYVLWVREHADGDLKRAVTAAELNELERLPGLVLERLPAYLPPTEGVELRRATHERTREDYLALVANAWGMAEMPRDVAARVFFDPASLEAPNVAAFVAYYDERPVSAAMTLVTHGVALACQAATIRIPAAGQQLPLPGPRGQTRGLAASCLCAALELSFQQLGATISLGQTSRLGAPVWLDLGYRQVTSYSRYRVPMTPRPAH